ncbi:unnamed protein product, partial [marine sediment metagenome]
WKSWTVTSDVQTEYAGDKTVTWVIKGATDYPMTETADHENYAYSKEYNGYDPYLEVTYVSVTVLIMMLMLCPSLEPRVIKVRGQALVFNFF